MFGAERERVERGGFSSLVHHCTALVHREAVFGRNFGAVFEHAKTLIREEGCTAMSHPGMKIVGMWIFVKSWDLGQQFWNDF